MFNQNNPHTYFSAPSKLSLRFSSRFLSKFAGLLSCVTISALTHPAGAIAQTETPKATSNIFNAKGELIGTATFVQTPVGVKVSLQVQKLAAGEHMVHLHENGKCDPPSFKSSGEHFDPKNAQETHEHHMHHKHEQGKHKPAGDLPNLTVQKDGNGSLSALLTELTLGSGKNSLLKQGGTSIIIHAGANGKSTIPNLDYKTRIACGVIKP